jgi:hypothetical protein
MVSTIMAPVLPTIAVELSTSPTEAVTAMSMYVLAIAFGPLIIGPLSEIHGRAPVLHVSGIWFLIWNIVCGFAKTKQVLNAAKFLARLGASSIFALAGGVLGNVWRPEERGRSLAPLPADTSARGRRRTYHRWLHGWPDDLAMDVLGHVCFPSCYDWSFLCHLSRNVRASHTEALCQESSFADIWTQHYHVNVEISGLHYLAIAFGEVAESQIGGNLLDAFHLRMQAGQIDGSISSEPEPEHRDPLMFLGYFVCTLGFLSTVGPHNIKFIGLPLTSESSSRALACG